jgi:uncharacterized Zn finger protein (UPF0148 family)
MAEELDIICDNCKTVWFSLVMGELLFIDPSLLCPRCEVPLFNSLETVEI